MGLVRLCIGLVGRRKCRLAGLAVCCRVECDVRCSAVGLGDCDLGCEGQECQRSGSLGKFKCLSWTGYTCNLSEAVDRLDGDELFPGCAPYL